MEDLVALIEDKIGFKIGIITTNYPITIECITFVNGIQKKEGEPILASQLAYSKQHAKEMLLANIGEKYLLINHHCSWRIMPHFEKNNIRCRIFVWGTIPSFASNVRIRKT